MNKEVISDKQAISIIIIFMSSTSTVLMAALSAEGDFWLAIILSVVMAMLMAVILVRLHIIFPGKNLYDICEACFGKFIGKGICILYIYFIFEEGALVFLNTKQFITETTIPETPQNIVIIPIAILCAWAVKKGTEVIGRWAEFFCILFILLILMMIVLLIPKMELNNFEPILYKGITPLFKGTLETFAFPFGEIVMLAFIFQHFKTKKSMYKVYMSGLLISGIILLLTATATVLVLGIDIAMTSYFPVFNAASGIEVGNFIQRLEIMAALIGVIGAFLKNSVILLITCKGVSKIFNLSDYGVITIPIAFLMINYSYIYYENRMDYIEYISDVWSYYVIIFEICIPIIILMIAEIKKKKMDYLM